MTPPCVECKHCTLEINNDFTPTGEYHCKKQTTIPCDITGHTEFLECHRVRKANYCPMFEQRIGIIQKILNWFRRRK